MNKVKSNRRSFSIHYAWLVLFLTFFTIIVAAGIRSTATVLINPLNLDFGWSRTIIASAISVNLFMFGLAAPVSGYLIDRFGPRRVMLASLVILILGLAGMLVMVTIWQFFILWGIVVGISSGALGTVISATVAYRWFDSRRGLALGILSSSQSTGQMFFVPLLMGVILAFNWRVGSMVMIATVLFTFMLVALWMKNDPEEINLRPYGAKEHEKPVNSTTGVVQSQVKKEVVVVSGVSFWRHPTFWFLAGSFFICGATAMGVVGVHLIPYTVEKGIPEMTAALVFGIMGGMNFVGSILSGWLTDRMDSRKILAFVFISRGAALFIVPFIHGITGLTIFGVIYGLNWFATVPPVMALTAETFGKESVGKIFGWIFLSHQLGSALLATGTGFIREYLGDYQVAFYLGGLMAVIAGLLAIGSLSSSRKALKEKAAV